MIAMILVLLLSGSSAGGDWAVCVFRNATALAETNATATEIADASLAQCRQMEMKARQAWIDEAAARGQNTDRAARYWDDFVVTLREDRRQDAVAAVLQARARR